MSAAYKDIDLCKPLNRGGIANGNALSIALRNELPKLQLVAPVQKRRSTRRTKTAPLPTTTPCNRPTLMRGCLRIMKNMLYIFCGGAPLGELCRATPPVVWATQSSAQKCKLAPSILKGKGPLGFEHICQLKSAKLTLHACNFLAVAAGITKARVRSRLHESN